MTETDQANPVDMDEIVSLCKRRGFIFQSSEIYGGLAGAWDYGPLGVEMKNNIKRAWWKAIVQERDDMVGMDAAILMHPRVWVASGHVETFADPMVDCRNCQARLRADEVEGNTCPNCGAVGQFTDARMFNLLFKTFAGPVEDEASVVYLRPETAQGMFVNFENVLTSSRKKLPFGMAQIGKSFRNEVNPRHFIFRTREFEQMEVEFFVRPEEAPKWHEYWIQERLSWYHKLGVRPEFLRLKAHAKEDLAHYAEACSDVEYLFPMGWLELEGIANRQDFDLQQHSKSSGVNLSYFDEEKGEHVVPFIIEPSGGGGPAAAGVHRRCVPAGGGARREAGTAEAAPVAGTGEGGGAAAEPQRAAGADGARGVVAAEAALHDGSTTTRRASGGGTVGRTRSGRRCA